MSFIELVKEVGPLLGYISTAITLFVLIKTKIVNKTDDHIREVVDSEGADKIHDDLGKRINRIEKSFEEFLVRDEAFKTKMDQHIKTQTDVDRKLMAQIIEDLYRQNKNKQCLDMNEFRRLTEVYEIYHSEEIHGNSYITELYEIMLLWERV